jgi:hypothetical protein
MTMMKVIAILSAVSGFSRMMPVKAISSMTVTWNSLLQGRHLRRAKYLEMEWNENDTAPATSLLMA